MSRPRFDAKALALAGLSRDQIRMLESLFKDVDALALIQVVLSTANTLFPAGRVLTDTATIDFDAATAGQMKASVIDGSITTTKLGGDITTAGKALLDDADAAAQLTTLGVSAFIQTLLDDANAAAALTTLGVSAFAQTLLDDASAAAALTTLGVSAYAQTILDDATAGDARTTLGLGTLATKDAVTDAYTVTNEVATRTLDADGAAGTISSPPTQAEVQALQSAVLTLADVVGTLIEDLKAKGIVA